MTCARRGGKGMRGCTLQEAYYYHIADVCVTRYVQCTTDLEHALQLQVHDRADPWAATNPSTRLAKSNTLKQRRTVGGF